MFIPRTIIALFEAQGGPTPSQRMSTLPTHEMDKRWRAYQAELERKRRVAAQEKLAKAHLKDDARKPGGHLEPGETVRDPQNLQRAQSSAIGKAARQLASVFMRRTRAAPPA